MGLYIYKPIRKIALSYAEDRIIKYLKEHNEAKSFDIYKISSKRSKPLKSLLEKEIVIKNERGKYQLRKEVRYFRDNGFPDEFFGNDELPINDLDELKEYIKKNNPIWEGNLKDVPYPIIKPLKKRGHLFVRGIDYTMQFDEKL